MADDQVPEATQKRQIRREVKDIETWNRPRVLAYRRQQDFWQEVTYGLLSVSAATAVGAAIAAGLSIRLLSIIFAGVSAGLSVINASLKAPTQAAESDKARAMVANLGSNITAFYTDSSSLSIAEQQRRLDQLRKDQQKAMELSEPRTKRLEKAMTELRGMSRQKQVVLGRRRRLW